MKAKQKTTKASADRVVKDIRRATRKQYKECAPGDPHLSKVSVLI